MSSLAPACFSRPWCRPSARWWLALWLSAAASLSAAPLSGWWSLAELQKPPAVQWGARDGAVQEVFYEGESYQGHPTRVFGYLARPQPERAGTKFPAIVLVHGGGGQAFRKWAEQWAARGYVALAMDLSGNGPGKVRMADGGPPLTTPNVFTKADTDEEMRSGWTYHAVAAVIRAHSVLTALPEVDRERVGITGISWGGYVTAIVAGLDHRLKVAVPVYGCGFLHEDSYWRTEFVDTMSSRQRERWVRLCDPSSYLSQVECPILFINGANDPRFFLDSHRRSFLLVRPELRYLSIQVGLKHGHIWTIGEVDRFIDSVLRNETPPPRLDLVTLQPGIARARVIAAEPIAQAAFIFTASTGPWVERKWTTIPAKLRDGGVLVDLPPGGPRLGFFQITDDRGFRATSPYVEINR